MKSSIFCKIPILFKNTTIAATIATMTATNRKIGLARMVAPNDTNALPIVMMTPVNDLNPPAIILGSMPPMTFLNTLAFCCASSKSNDSNESLIPPNELLTCSNLEPEANTLTASLASCNWSFNSPALADNLAISSGSVASAIAPFNDFNSALMAPMPPSFNGISTSFILWLVISYF